MMAVELQEVKVIHSGWAKFVLATIRLPNGAIVRREIEDHGAAVAVLPYDPQRKTAVLVRQFRAPVLLAAEREETLEAIAGSIEGPDPRACARREALEEAGLELDSLDYLFTGWTMPGVSTERMHFFLASYREGSRIGPGGGLASEHEFITVVEFALAELANMVEHGRLDDVKALVLLQTLRLRRPDLFRQ
jgi:nudix-type nucleoside diphosphatase (YffH/AdpP family)